MKVKALLQGRLYELTDLEFRTNEDMSVRAFVSMVDSLVAQGKISKPTKTDMKAVYKQITGKTLKIN